MAQDPSQTSFFNSHGDLKKNIEYLNCMERQSGSMDVISPLYISRMLNVPLEDVEKCMKEMELQQYGRQNSSLGTHKNDENACN